MIKVDISNVWGDLALADMLACEQEVFNAHQLLTEGKGIESAELLINEEKLGFVIHCSPHFVLRLVAPFFLWEYDLLMFLW